MAFEMQDQVLELIDNLTTKLEKTVSVLKGEYASLRAGRANPHILDKVSVDYYGTFTPINQMGNISVTDARCLTITLWDASMLKTVDKAIQEANIGINPTNDGKVLRLVFPELTEERRRELVKQVKKQGEDSKVALRNLRRECMDGLKKLKNDKVITEDELASYEKDVDKELAKSVDQVEALMKDKEKELMTV